MRARIRLSLEILRQASRAIDPAQCSFDDPSFSADDEARDLFVRAFDDRDGNAARLESGPLRFVALIAAIDKGHRHHGLLRGAAPSAARGRRDPERWRGDLTFYRQAERIDGDMSFTALDFLAGVEAARAAGFRCLDGLAIDNDGRRRGLAASASRAAITSTAMICGHSPLSAKHKICFERS